jgi:shikimate kinase
MTAASQRIVLIGMMGAGKTTVGRLLAGRLGWAFWDNDEALFQATGATAANIQLAAGQRALHRLENRLLADALARTPPTVFAAAASVALAPQIVTGAVTVWLRTTVAQEAEHLADSGQHHRPPADPALLSRIARAREPLYAALADVTVDVADEPADTCDRVVEALVRRAHGED